MANGSFTVSGVQFVPGTGSQQTLGPITIDFSDQINVQTLAIFPDNTLERFSESFWLIPNTFDATGTLQIGFTLSDQISLSPTLPSFFSLDPNNPPSFIFLYGSAGSSVTVYWV